MRIHAALDQLSELEERVGRLYTRFYGKFHEFPIVAELWWESEEAFRVSGRTAEGREAGRLLLEDEAKFIDLANSPLWLNREQVIYAGP